MTIAAQIQHIALEFASNAQHRAFALQSKLAEIEARKVAIEAELHTANLARKAAHAGRGQSVGPKHALLLGPYKRYRGSARTF